MNADFDGLRRNIANDFNAVVCALDEELQKDFHHVRKPLSSLRMGVVGLLLLYEDGDDPDSSLIDKIPITEIPEEE